MNLLDLSARIALTAFLHDLGKLAERAGVEINREILESNQQLYCPHHKEFTDARGWFSHLHAAYTGIAWDVLEATGHFPDLKHGCPPFSTGNDGNVTDSAVNASAAHHKPNTFLQWIVATADRVASGFERDNFDTEYNNKKERDNHYCARLLTLFEQIEMGEIEEGKLKWRYPLKPLSPQSLFPQQDCTPKNNSDAQAEYLVLWNSLLEGLKGPKKIPPSHRNNLPLWLDHFDSLWLTMTHAIPAATAFGVKPEVSLYDHSKAAAALATALWRWHHAHQLETVESVRERWDEKKILLVQGDFFGIQNFIFAEGGETNKHANKLLRGRSFQVALMAECAALSLLEALELPPTSQIINAAGKFLIVAPNTASAKAAIEKTRKKFNGWCLQHTYGEIGIGLAITEASCNDFSRGRFADLQKRLFEQLDKAKHHRFDLCGETAPVFEGFLDQFDNDLGVCKINGRYPAEIAADEKRNYSRCRLADDQISIGEALTKKSRVLISSDAGSLPNLSLDYFGWNIAFVPEGDVSGKYGQLAHERKLVRCWDFDLPEEDGAVFHGYARRFVNTYVPRWIDEDRTLKTQGKYDRLSDDEIGECTGDEIKSLHVLAAEDGALQDRHSGLDLESSASIELDSRFRGNDKTKWRGEIALVTLKGDVDNLGSLFQKGLEKPTFAKMASLSRQMNLFFALWLPWFCEHGTDDQGVARYRNTYTVFAGGDDFFLIGPWKSTIALSGEIQQHFADYVVNNTITFSAGMVMTQPRVPARQLARSAEAALEKSKDYYVGANLFAQQPTKNAVTLWNQTVSWADWHALMTVRAEQLQAVLDQAEDHGAPLSSGMVYSLLQLADKAERDQPGNKNRRPEDSLWRSQLAYRTSRFITDRIRKKGDEDIKAMRYKLFQAVNGELGDALNQHRGSYRLPLSVLLYSRRE